MFQLSRTSRIATGPCDAAGVGIGPAARKVRGTTFISPTIKLRTIAAEACLLSTTVKERSGWNEGGHRVSGPLALEQTRATRRDSRSEEPPYTIIDMVFLVHIGNCVPTPEVETQPARTGPRDQWVHKAA